MIELQGEGKVKSKEKREEGEQLEEEQGKLTVQGRRYMVLHFSRE